VSDLEIQLRIDAALAEWSRKNYAWLDAYRGDLKQRVRVLNFLFNPQLGQSQADLSRELEISPQRASRMIDDVREQLAEIGIELRNIDFDC
jgi:hypothetical protein